MLNLNLLPPAERSAAFHNILQRFFAALLLFAALCAGIITIFFAVGQIFFRIHNDALAQELQVEKSTGTVAATQAFESEAKATNALFSYASQVALQPQDDDAYLIKLLSSLAPAGVRLHSIVINSVSGSITIGGIADTRDEFLMMQQNLQSQKNLFTNVQSPLSNLLSPVNVSFSFIITLKR